MTWPQGPGDPYGQQQPGGYDPYGQQQQPQSGYDPYAQQPYSSQPYSGQPSYDPYNQAGYQQPYQQGYAQPRRTNTMAILALVFAFVFAPLGIVFGHMAKKQIKQNGEDGDGLATAGLVIGYIFTGLILVGCCVDVIMFGAMGIVGSSSSSSYDSGYDDGYTFILQSLAAFAR
ncbi:MAG: DUF4190 domain-containing protein [Actinocatenispora sp.]